MSFDAHFQLVTIHPWVDGNGRMARLVMNHLQYEFGLIPSKIVKEDKAEYIRSLIDAREQESLTPYRNFMVEEHIRNLTRKIEAYNKSQISDPINISIDPINKVHSIEPGSIMIPPYRIRVQQLSCVSHSTSS